MTQRVFNFSAGPAVLPEPVLAEVQRDLMALARASGRRFSRSAIAASTFEDIIQQAETNLRQLLAIPDDYAVLLLQGGARLQFSMIPMNLMGERPAVVRLHRHRLVEQVRGPGSGEVWRGARRLGRQADELRSAAATRPI